MGKHGQNPQKPKDLLNWAIDQDLDIIEGANDDIKKFRFNRRLESLHGQSFVIEGKTVMGRKFVDPKSQDLMYVIEEAKA